MVGVRAGAEDWTLPLGLLLDAAQQTEVRAQTGASDPQNGLAIGPGVLNDPFFGRGRSMSNPKIAIVAYCLAIGFILAVAFHSPSNTLITASVTAVQDPKWDANSGCAEAIRRRLVELGLKVMPARSSNIPHNRERSALQKMSTDQGLLLSELYPAGKSTIAAMLAKGWIKKQTLAIRGARYLITPEGQAALKSKIPL
jgi:hypothetical protein